MKKVLGFNKFTSKKGTACCFLGVVGDFTPSEKDRGSVGQKVEVISIYGDLGNKITPDIVGKMVDFIYSINGQQAYLQDVIVK